MAERFPSVTGEELNLFVDKTLPENSKTIFSYAVSVLAVFFILTQCSNTQARCENSDGFNYKFQSVQQSLNENVKERHTKRRKGDFLSALRKEKAIN